jgi:hypothetical protein
VVVTVVMLVVPVDLVDLGGSLECVLAATIAAFSREAQDARATDAPSTLAGAEPWERTVA